MTQFQASVSKVLFVLTAVLSFGANALAAEVMSANAAQSSQTQITPPLQRSPKAKLQQAVATRSTVDSSRMEAAAGCNCSTDAAAGRYVAPTSSQPSLGFLATTRGYLKHLIIDTDEIASAASYVKAKAQGYWGRRSCSAPRETASVAPSSGSQPNLSGCRKISTGSMSFYGPNIPKKNPTFSGAPFNPCNLGIAHNSKALVGQKAIVRDLDTGKFVTTVINDHCPACKGPGHTADLTEGTMLKFRSNPYENLQRAELWVCGKAS